MKDVLYSEASVPFTWPEAATAKEIYGPKGAGLAALPRAWTLPFILVSAEDSSNLRHRERKAEDDEFWKELGRLQGVTGKLIVRSSVIGETIWDRGRYQSIPIDAIPSQLEQQSLEACASVLVGAAGHRCGLVIQAYFEPSQRGEFGNLIRISKTRDQWELTTRAADVAFTSRMNSQRDAPANEHNPLSAKPGLPAARLFGSLAAWINNSLMEGHSQRFNCEWVSDNTRFYVVQIDAEDEDLFGVNPLRRRIAPVYCSRAGEGHYLKSADDAAIAQWDKLKVLAELWNPSDTDRPYLFFVPLQSAPSSAEDPGLENLSEDFAHLVGPDNIVVRTSSKTGQAKVLNLPRSECLTPIQAAAWCATEKDRLLSEGVEIEKLAFVTHRYIDARSSAWARADPSDPTVEIHSLWGLPDALQYCPYDIWEVHVPTASATEYPEYKSNILVAQPNGSWEYVRVKNEIARSLSIPRKAAIEVARRTFEIATRLDRACHVMWFVGCADSNGHTFNLPWYWTEAHQTDSNADRARHHTFTVSNRDSLRQLQSFDTDKSRLMILLRPDSPEFFRDNSFLKEVAEEASSHSMPIDLEGSTLAHAYYQLIGYGCTVIARGEKDYTRVRKVAPFGKIVRDKVPEKIEARKELESVASVPARTQQAFLIGKVLEEALEVRESETSDEKKIELADILEIVRALGHASGITLNDIISAADQKREKLGGFEGGKILLQTAIGGPGRTELFAGPGVAQVLSRSTGPDTRELPFTFFGFAELDQPRLLHFESLGFSLELTLKSDRLVLRVVREPEQLELPLSLEVDSGESSGL
jgi:predicted house-cleaning noncanonical NTP pyrophosphatase (MazG superfamily)